MPLRQEEDNADPMCCAPGSVPGATCRLVGHLRLQDGGMFRLYPSLDAGIWLEIDPRDILERIDSPDPAKPATIVVHERLLMSLRMDVTASAVRALLTAATGEGGLAPWSDWRASRGRSQSTKRRGQAAPRFRRASPT